MSVSLFNGNNQPFFDEGILQFFQVFVVTFLNVAFSPVVGYICALFGLYRIVVANIYKAIDDMVKGILAVVVKD